MRWLLTTDIDDFLARTDDFLRSRPALHTTQLSVAEKLRTRGADAFGGRPLLGRLEHAGEVHAVCYRLPTSGLGVTALTPDQADALAADLHALGHALPYVSAEHATATAFAQAWQRRTGATPSVRVRLHLYRLGTLTPPDPSPAGRARPVGGQDHDHLLGWCRDLAADLGENVTITADTWPTTRFAEKTYTYWETHDGVPVSMAGLNPMVAGQVRVDPVYTPARHRRRGYAAAITAEVSRAALTAGATDVVLYTNAANPTSNALYRRIGYRPIADIDVCDFT
ncbi:GNAT family N-acetyltransferase [Actinokineospora sp. UTMC 2448]|uniref:GNAT family N-acetyltransferase n=1 Tax=Actinokineospora sp. UTMC 2448 TaxID=2268449 RepID=UPI002164780C|nr:GNAT family N-acetyltransferase [Actinokineospora sp. UTMC 2448]UVS80476.1 putative acetyltransferase [Actinokineospora sp. UTMC 2448]